MNDFRALSETYILVLENQNNADLLYQIITDPGATEPFQINKDFLIKTLSSPEDAKQFLSAMTPEQSQTEINVYGVAAAKKFLPPDFYNTLFGNGDTSAVTHEGIIYFGERANKESKNEVLADLRHELQHAIDRVAYPFNKTDYDNNAPTSSKKDSPRIHSVAKSSDNNNYDSSHTAYSDYMAAFISPEEIRGRIAESRNFLGVISNPQQFKEKWDEAQKEFSSADKKQWLDPSTNFKTPSAFRQFVYAYNMYITDPAEKQKLYNYILRTAMDNTVAQNSSSVPSLPPIPKIA